MLQPDMIVTVITVLPNKRPPVNTTLRRSARSHSCSWRAGVLSRLYTSVLVHVTSAIFEHIFQEVVAACPRLYQDLADDVFAVSR